MTLALTIPIILWPAQMLRLISGHFRGGGDGHSAASDATKPENPDQPLTAPLTSTNFRPKHSLSGNPKIPKAPCHGLNNSWVYVQSNDGWLLIVKQDQPEGSDSSNTWYDWIKGLLGGGFTAVESVTEDGCRLIVVDEVVSPSPDCPTLYEITPKCREAMCAEPPQGKKKNDEEFYIVTINNVRHIFMHGECPPTSPVFGTIKFESQQAAKNYLKKLGFKLSK